MHRVTETAKVDMFREALRRLPYGLRWLPCVVDLFTADPVFAGICVGGYDPAPDGRLWSETGHVLSGFHSLDGETTIVTPPRDCMDPCAMVHELGHVLDDHLGLVLRVPITTEYSKRNGNEGFAEWVCSWTCDEYRAHRETVERDERSRELWATISAARWNDLEHFA